MARELVKSLIVGLTVGAVAATMGAVGALLGLTSRSAVWPILTVCSILVAFIHYAKQAVVRQMENRLSTLKRRLERVRRDVGDIHGLVRLAPYTQKLPLPIGGGWALTGDSAALLAREVMVRKPERVFELGSGASTLILGQILKRSGRGRVISVDHDPAWARQTREYAEFLGLQDVVSVVDAPLKDIVLGDETVRWYDISTRCLETFGPIDFLIVDGPPQTKDVRAAARYPAFPLLRDRLSTHAVIFVDDADRKAESEMIERWKGEAPEWLSRRFDTVDGVCILSRIGNFQGSD
jgi:predicted O-methyltransferase YrrM